MPDDGESENPYSSILTYKLLAYKCDQIFPSVVDQPVIDISEKEEQKADVKLEITYEGIKQQPSMAVQSQIEQVPPKSISEVSGLTNDPGDEEEK